VSVPEAFPALRGCPRCGLVQAVPPVPRGSRACCARCAGSLPRSSGGGGRDNGTAAALALAALIIYPLAISLPLIGIEKFGHTQQSSVLQGVSALLGRGHFLVGLLVLLCSVVLPPAKLLAILVISLGRGLGSAPRAFTWRLVEWTGRWGMLDVLLVAILVAVLKLGDLVTVSVGPGLAAFALCVCLSLAAAASFDPHRMWEPGP
jgi:paraquat-inducible protein A